jgi:hypothetical protein
MLWWMLTFLMPIFLYFVTLYASSGVAKTDPCLGEASCKSGFFRNLLASLIAFVAFDAAVFHSGLYATILETESYAGRISVRAREEINRKPTGLQEVAVLGDSRIVEGFSAKIANELASQHGQVYLNMGIDGTTPRLWYLLLREIDPSADRYNAIVLPVKFDDLNVSGEIADHSQDISMAAPLLRYGDACLFGRSFRQWSNQCTAFAACVLRGHAFQADLLDLLEHPLKRYRTIRERPARLKAEYDYMGIDEDVRGISYDPATKRLYIPPRFTGRTRSNIRVSVSSLDRSIDLPLSHAWTDRILDRYAHSSTTIVLLPMPRGPLAGVVQPVRKTEDSLKLTAINKRAILMEENLFSFLESPEFYKDGSHLNAKGRLKFTEHLVNQVLANPKVLSANGAPAPQSW